MITPEDAIRIAAQVTGVAASDITGPRTLRTHFRARMIAILLMRDMTKVIYSKFGLYLHRDRSSVSNAMREIEPLRQADRDFDRRCELAIRIAKDWDGCLSEARARNPDLNTRAGG